MDIFDRVVIENELIKEKLIIDIGKDSVRTLWDKVSKSNNYLLSFNSKKDMYYIIDKYNKICIATSDLKLGKLILSRSDILLRKGNIKVIFVCSKNNVEIDLKDIIIDKVSVSALEKSVGVSKNNNSCVSYFMRDLKDRIEVNLDSKLTIKYM